MIAAVQSLSHIWLCDSMDGSTPGFTVLYHLLELFKLMSIESIMPSNHLILYGSHLLLPSIFPSIRVFSNELALCIMWPKYWSFSFSISPSKLKLIFSDINIFFKNVMNPSSSFIVLEMIFSWKLFENFPLFPVICNDFNRDN